MRGLLAYLRAPDQPQAVTVLWNYDELDALVRDHSCVVAVLSGHDHDGGFGTDEHGVHHITLQAPLECEEDEVAYGTIHMYRDRMELEGCGRVPSRVLYFREGV